MAASDPTLPVWKRLLFSLLVMAGFFGGAELVLYAAGVRTVIELEDPFQGFSGLVPVFEQRGDTYETRFTEPHRIFNDQSFAAEKPATGLRIFTLGGSSAHGYPWDAGASFTGVLEDVLRRAQPERSIESVNAAGVSYAMHRLRFVAREVLRYAPDVLVIYSGHNEFVEPDFFGALRERSERYYQLRGVLARSRLYAGLRTLLLPATVPERSDAARFDMFVRRNETLSFDAAAKQEIVAAFREGLREIVRATHAAGALPVLATVPANLRDWRPKRSLSPAFSEEERRAWTDTLAEAESLQQPGRYADALRYLHRASAQAPDHAETHYEMGRAYEGISRWDEAREAYARACDLDASPVRRLSSLNEAIREVAEHEDARLVDVDRIFAARSLNGLVGFDWIEDYVHPTLEGHQLIAWHLWDSLAAVPALDLAPPQRPLFEEVAAGRRTGGGDHNAVWLFNQGSVLRHAGHIEQATTRFREALTLRPDYAPAHAGLGYALGKQGRAAEALPHLERALALGLDTVDVHQNLAMALHSGGRDAEAAKHYRRALAESPEFLAGLNNLALLLATSDEPGVRQGDEAVRHASEAARLTGNGDPVVLDTLAAAYAAAGRFGDAVETAERALVLAERPGLREEIGARLEDYRARRSGRP